MAGIHEITAIFSNSATAAFIVLNLREVMNCSEIQESEIETSLK